MRKTTGYVLLLAIAVIVAAVGYADYTDPRDDYAGEVVIIHTNDTHGYYDQYLGFTAVAAAQDYYGYRGATVFTVDAGDIFEGAAVADISLGEATVGIVNTVGYDIFVPGNHDFDYGLTKMLENENALDGKVLCANMIYTDTGENVFPGYTVLTKGGVSLGVFGLITPNMLTLTKLSNVEGLTFTDPVTAAADAVSALEDEGVDYIIGVGHLGVQHSQSVVTSDDVCAAVDGIDVFIDGHSHTAMAGGKVIDGSVTLKDSETVIASTGCYLKAVGVVTMVGDTVTATLEMSARSTDAAVSAAVTAAEDKNAALLAKVLFTAAEPLDGERAHVRTQETALGDLAADAFRNVSGADVSLINGGAIRESFKTGEITVADFLAVFPFDDVVQVREISGADLRATMEHSLSYLPEQYGGFLQISGMALTYDVTAPAGERIVAIEVGGVPLEDDRTYTVASRGYLFGGGDGCTTLNGLPLLSQAGIMDMIIREYLAGLGTVTAPDGGRIVAV